MSFEINKSNILSAYRKLLKLSYLIKPEEKKYEIYQKIRNEFRNKSHLNNEKDISEALKSAYSSISYIKMVTPKSIRDKHDGITRITLQNTDDSSLSKRPITNWHGKNLDPDAVSRHTHTLKRAGFKNNRHAKGIF